MNQERIVNILLHNESFLVTYGINSASRRYQLSYFVHVVHYIDTATSVRIFSWLDDPRIKWNRIFVSNSSHLIILVILWKKTVSCSAMLVIWVIIAVFTVIWHPIYLLRLLSLCNQLLFFLSQMLVYQSISYLLIRFFQFLNSLVLFFKLFVFAIIGVLDQIS